MDKKKWDERYKEEKFAYGKEPNLFFKEWLPKFKPGSILMPADGEGRNGVYAAKLGWKVTSFEPTTLKIIPNGNMITEIGTYKISMTMPKTDKPMDDHGKYLTIWEKQPDGSLKVKIETWNSDVDPMTMMKSMDQMMGNEQKEEKEDMK